MKKLLFFLLATFAIISCSEDTLSSSDDDGGATPETTLPTPDADTEESDTEESGTEELTYTTILSAMGKLSTDVDSSSGLAVTNAYFDNFVMNSSIGSASTNFRLWANGESIRSYAGNTVTFTALNEAQLTSITFDVSQISEATAGSVSGSTWSGEASEVTLTMAAGTNFTITVTYTGGSQSDATAPKITALTPSTLEFVAEGEALTSTISGDNLDGATISHNYTGSHFTIGISGSEISVSAPANPDATIISENVTISVEGGNSVSLALSQAATLDEGTLGEDFLISNTTMGISGSSLSGSLVLGGITFEYDGVSTDDSFGTLYLDNSKLGYIRSTTPFSGVKELTIVGNGYVMTNLVVYVGTTSGDITTEVVSSSAAGSGWGSEYIYTIPEDAQYISFEANPASSYDAGVTSIAVSYTSTLEDSAVVIPDGVVEGEPYYFGGTTILEAMGKSSDDYVDSRISIVDCTLPNGLYITGAQGTHATIAPCVYDGSIKDIRVYKGNTLTFKSEDKKIMSITFVSTHNYLTTTASGYTYTVSGANSVWTGYASEVEFSTSDASYINSFIVTLEE